MSRNKPRSNSDIIKRFAVLAVHNAFAQSKQEGIELKTAVRNAIVEIIDILSDSELDGDRHIKAGVEGAIEGVLLSHQDSTKKLSSQIEYLQARLNYENYHIKKHIDLVIREIEDIGKTRSANFHRSVATAISEIEYPSIKEN